MRDFVEFFLPVIALIIGAFIVIFGGSALAYAAIGPRACSAKWPGASEWSFWGGCRVQTERGYIPERALLFNDIIVREAK